MKVEIEIAETTIVGMLITAGQGIAYWASRSDRPLTEATRRKVSIELGEPLEGRYVPKGMTGPITHVDLSPAALQRGLALAAHTHPKIFAAAMGGAPDADAADVIVQLAVFGEVVYG